MPQSYLKFKKKLKTQTAYWVQVKSARFYRMRKLLLRFLLRDSHVSQPCDTSCWLSFHMTKMKFAAHRLFVFAHQNEMSRVCIRLSRLIYYVQWLTEGLITRHNKSPEAQCQRHSTWHCNNATAFHGEITHSFKMTKSRNHPTLCLTIS